VLLGINEFEDPTSEKPLDEIDPSWVNKATSGRCPTDNPVGMGLFPSITGC
jgi:hypothetical protein